jgi:hypothetical protein
VAAVDPLMSVDIDDFETSNAETLDDLTLSEQVLAFLAEHDDEAWRPSAIAEETAIDRDSVGPTLSRLQERGLVRHKSPYWAITDDRDRVRTAIQDDEGPVDVLVDLVSESLEALRQ